MPHYEAIEGLLFKTCDQLEAMLAIRGHGEETDRVFAITDLYVTLILQYFASQNQDENVRIKPQDLDNDVKQCFKIVERLY